MKIIIQNAPFRGQVVMNDICTTTSRGVAKSRRR
jgi:hypothetical protein